ncbi:MAG: sortase [Clostridia bacterium]|nr:sortase [Clostridia bacterium]
MNRKKRRLLLCLAALAFAVCLAGTVDSLLEKRQARLDHEQSLLLAGLPSLTLPATVPPTEEVGQTAPSESREPTSTLPQTAPPVQAPEETVPATAPIVTLTDPMAEALKSTDIAALQRKNQDVVGWILIPGTSVSYPLMRGTDNAYYLKHTWLKEKSSAGSVYMDYRCAPTLEEFNTIVYGHHLKDGSMFSPLRQYREQAFGEAHPSVYVITQTEVKRYDVFAAYDTQVDDTHSYRLGLKEEAGKQAYINYCLNHSVYSTGLTPLPTDRLLTLSTCPKGTGNDYKTRLVVHAVLTYETDIQAQ